MYAHTCVLTTPRLAGGGRHCSGASGFSSAHCLLQLNKRRLEQRLEPFAVASRASVLLVTRVATFAHAHGPRGVHVQAPESPFSKCSLTALTSVLHIMKCVKHNGLMHYIQWLACAAFTQQLYTIPEGAGSSCLKQGCGLGFWENEICRKCSTKQHNFNYTFTDMEYVWQVSCYSCHTIHWKKLQIYNSGQCAQQCIGYPIIMLHYA